MLACFKKARIVNGMDYVSDLIDLETQISNSSAVFTGEGSFDKQTLEGKVVSKIMTLCSKHRKPLYIICGVNKLTPEELSHIATA
jgi:glycerate kinase